MEMIPFLNVCHKDMGLPPAPFDCDLYDTSLVDELTSMHDSELERLITADFINLTNYNDDAIFDLENLQAGIDASDPDGLLDKVLRNDCKWSGCDLDCAKSHGTGLTGCYDPHMLISPNDIYSQTVIKIEPPEIQPYTPDSDHCYYAPYKEEDLSAKQTFSDVDDKMDILKNIPTPPSTSDSPSETSSEDEVDVVTVPDEYHPPIMIPRFEVLRRSTRSSRNIKKPQRTYNKVISAKTLKAAMKRTRIQHHTRRPYRRRKVHNSVETTPSSSMPSSAHSSRCSSDVEDFDKRRTHNSSERKRREAQRTALQNLRIVIPDLANHPKAPKVMILNSATNLVKKLELNKRTLKELKLRELQKRSDLTAKLNQLKMRLKMSHKV